MQGERDEFGVVELAQRLVAIPSVTGGEGSLAAFLAGWLEAAGLRVELQEAAPGRPNLLAVLPSSSANADEPLGLLFHAHTDTVAAYGQPEPFSGCVQEGCLWGRGSVDQKGGLAAAAAALAAYARRGQAPKAAVGLAAVIDEESEHRGSMALVRSGIRARRAVVTEPSGLKVVVGCKGTVPFRIRVHGKTAHGSRPWLGVNAVEKAIRVAQALMSLPCPEAEVPGLGAVRGSTNLGVMRGGVAYNIVPDQCEVWFDRRTVPGETQAGVLVHVQALLREMSAQDADLRAEVDIARPDWNWEPIARRGLNPTLAPAGSGLPEWVGAQHARVAQQPAQYAFTDGYNEMDFLVNDLGIPTVQYGPGDSRLCHTDEEKLDVAQLLACTLVYVKLVEHAMDPVGNTITLAKGSRG